MAALQVDQQAYQQLAASSRQMGDYVMAIHYEIEARTLQIQITEALTRAKRLEAESMRLQAEADREALVRTNSLTESKRLEIEARLANAKAKAVEADANGAVIRALEQEIAAIRANVQQRQASAGATDQDTNARLRNASAVDRQTDALNRQNKTSDGFAKNADGSAAGSFNNFVPVDKIFDITQRRQRGELTAADLAETQAAFKQAKDLLNYSQEITRLSPGSGSFAFTSSSEAAFRSAQSALQYVEGLVQQQEQDKARASGTTSPKNNLVQLEDGSFITQEKAQSYFGGKSTPAAVQTVNTTRTVNINLGSTNTPIAVASEKDEQMLVGFLQRLEQDMRRAA